MKWPSWSRKRALLASSVASSMQVPLGARARRIADHARAATDEGDWPPARTLEVRQQEDLHQVPDVQGWAGRVEADVGADGASQQPRLEAVRVGLQEPAPGELGEQAVDVGHRQHDSSRMLAGTNAVVHAS